MVKLCIILKLEQVNNKKGKRFNKKKKSSVKVHCLLSGHVCSFDDFTVLNYDSLKFKRSIKESLLVTKDKELDH